MEKTLEPLLFYFKGQRRADEAFGDFCARVGFSALRDYAAGYIPAKDAAELPKVFSCLKENDTRGGIQLCAWPHPKFV